MEVTSEQGANLENTVEADLIEAVLESNPMVHRNSMRRLGAGRERKKLPRIADSQSSAEKKCVME